MDEIFDMIIYGVTRVIGIMKDFKITAYGFTTTLWDIQMGFVFTGLVASLIFIISPAKSREYLEKSKSGSERVPKKGRG